MGSLEKAIRDGSDYIFETTLGGETIADLLAGAASAGCKIRIFYVGLESAEKHIARVQARIASGGHPIDEDTIRRRYSSSRLHLVRLIALLDELVVFDNSHDADPTAGNGPSLKKLLVMRAGVIRDMTPELETSQGWAKPILAAAMEHHAQMTRRQV
ncbi:MAG TPA: hypothetical protein VGK20_18190 [Candidatus Binatia bacterium]